MLWPVSMSRQWEARYSMITWFFEENTTRRDVYCQSYFWISCIHWSMLHTPVFGSTEFDWNLIFALPTSFFMVAMSRWKKAMAILKATSVAWVLVAWANSRSS